MAWLASTHDTLWRYAQDTGYCTVGGPLLPLIELINYIVKRHNSNLIPLRGVPKAVTAEEPIG